MTAKHSRVWICLTLTLSMLWLIGCSGGESTVPKGVTPPGVDLGKKEDDVPKGPDYFKTLSPSETGVDFTFYNGEQHDHLAILESLGGGVGLIDYDGDGLLDLFCIGGGDYDKSAKEYAKDKKNPPNILGHPCKLYRNKGNFQFEDVTDKVLKRKGDWFFTHGCAVADYNCDGWPDLVVTGYHDLMLFRNDPADKNDPTKGRILIDVSKESGITKGINWSSSAGWADLDGDGYPELYVCNYANWNWKTHVPCSYDGSVPDVCSPKTFKGEQDCLFQNNRDGTFTNVSQTVTRLKRGKGGKKGLVPDKKGLMPGGEHACKGLGVIIADYNKDGLPDVYVANDTVDNHLYLNYSKSKDFIFHETAMTLGVARDRRATPNGSMGLAVGDYDGSGRPSIFVTNYEGEMQALYHNIYKPAQNGRNEVFYFRHDTVPAGISSIGQNYVAWGTTFLDLDNRGKLDLIFLSGHAIRYPKKKEAGQSQSPILFRNIGEGKFKNYSSRGGDYFRKKHRSRGLAAGDLNNDGLIDFVSSHIGQKVSIVKNIIKTENHWLGIELRGKNNADVVGAELILEANGMKQHRYQVGGGSYASAPDQRHVFGLGSATKIKKLTVVWPGGKTQEWADLDVDKYHRLVQK